MNHPDAPADQADLPRDSAEPPWPAPFHTPVLGTVFAARAAAAARLHPGDGVLLVPDPPDTDDPNVWVHAPGGDVVGHLPLDIGARLARWMLAGGRCRATVDKVKGDAVESWRRLILVVDCRDATSAATSPARAGAPRG